MTDLAATLHAPPRAKPQKDWLSRKEASHYLTQNGYSISAESLANKAANNNKGCGPAFERRGWKQVQYRRTDLDAWLIAITTRVL